MRASQCRYTKYMQTYGYSMCWRSIRRERKKGCIYRIKSSSKSTYIYIYRIYLLQRRVNQKHETIMQRACIEGVREYNICTYVRILYGIFMNNMVYIYINRHMRAILYMH